MYSLFKCFLMGRLVTLLLSSTVSLLLLPCVSLAESNTSSGHKRTEISFQKQIIVGAEQIQYYLPMLKKKRVGLVVNQTSIVGNRHLVDTLIANNINVQAIFAPEHGFRGDYDAGEKFNSSIDLKTGVPLI